MKTVTMKKQPEPEAIAPTVTMKATPKKRSDPLCQSVADAEAILSSLQAKRAELQATAAELTEAKKASAFDAFTGGNHELVNIARSVRANEADLESIGHAIAEGERRLLLAKAHAADLADQANAAKILETCAELEQAGNSLGAAAKTFAETSRQVSSLLAQLHAVGITSPSSEQYRVFGGAALKTMIAGSLWSRDYPAIAPGERKTFDGLISGWTQSIRARVRGRVKGEAA